MRLDRLASVYFFHPLARLLPDRAGIPILMYHAITETPETNGHPYYITSTSAEIFAAQMAYLANAGYRTLSLTEAAYRLHANGVNGFGLDKFVVITFDDGYLDFYTRAFPILRRHGFSAPMFLPTAYIGDANWHFKGRECLSWSQVRELHRLGIEFGSHTVTHPELKSLQPEDVAYEIRYSKATIEDRLGCAVTSFAYPFAFPETDRGFVAHLRSILESSQYEAGVSTALGVAGRGDDKFFLKRLPVNCCDDRALLRAKIEGGYNWLHPIQRTAKLMKSRLLRQTAYATH